MFYICPPFCLQVEFKDLCVKTKLLWNPDNFMSTYLDSIYDFNIIRIILKLNC